MKRWPGFVLLGLLLVTACQSRYYYRDTFRAAKRMGSFDLAVSNKNPQMLGTNFEQDIYEYALKRLRKEGFQYNPKKPDYHITLDIWVDSAITKGVGYLTPGPYVYVYGYSRESKAIELELRVTMAQSGSEKAYRKYDLYFFNDPNRDLKRTRGVVKYLLGNLDEK